MEINARVHTIFVTIGATNAGKSHFCLHHLVPALKRIDEKSFPVNVQYLSSDELRRDLLGDVPASQNKYSELMMDASAGAFDLLFHKLDLVTSFPIKAEFVIMDTTGLSETFRDRVKETAFKNNYFVKYIVFDYQNPNDYRCLNPANFPLTMEHARRLRIEVLGKLGKSCYRTIIKKPFLIQDEKENKKEDEKEEQKPLRVNVKDWDAYRSCFLDAKKQYLIVGDAHACLDELLALLKKVGFSYDAQTKELKYIKPYDGVPDCKVILAGDYIDKGTQNNEMVEFLCENTDVFHLVRGNHERSLFNFLKKKKEAEEQKEEKEQQKVNEAKIKQEEEDDEEEELIESKTELKTQDEEWGRVFNARNELTRKNCDRFRFLYQEWSHPFLWYKSDDGTSRSFVVTHSPCPLVNLGHLDLNSLHEQISTKISSQFQLKDIIPLKDTRTLPFHLFGHVSFSEPYNGKEQRNGNHLIGLDTGCAQGGFLSGIVLGYTHGTKYRNKLKFFNSKPEAKERQQEKESEKTNDPVKEKAEEKKEEQPKEEQNSVKPRIFDLASLKEQASDQNVQDLVCSDKELTRIKWLVKDKVNFISGTVALLHPIL